MESQKMASPKMRPIWFFVGLVLLAMGTVILLAALISPAGAPVLPHLKTNLWWGLLMMAAGGVFVFANRKTTVD